MAAATDLNLDDLIGTLKDTNEFNDLKKKIGRLSKGERPLDAPAARTTEERATRKAHYDESKKTVTRWQPLVKANREAPHISFSAEASEGTRHVITVNSLMDSFTPSTDLEKELAATFGRVSHAAEDHQGFPEDSSVSFEEYAKRQNEMAKLKALMSYHDMKLRRQNKIKSKSYRKIRKKQKERAEEAEAERLASERGPKEAKRLQEAAVYSRAQERMTLKHRNKSKWAMRVLRQGGVANSTHREAMHKYLQRAQELLEKVSHTNAAGSDDDDDEDDDEGDGDDGNRSDQGGSDSEDEVGSEDSDGENYMQTLGGRGGAGLTATAEVQHDSDGVVDEADAEVLGGGLLSLGRPASVATAGSKKRGRTAASNVNPAPAPAPAPAPTVSAGKGKGKGDSKGKGDNKAVKGEGKAQKAGAASSAPGAPKHAVALPSSAPAVPPALPHNAKFDSMGRIIPEKATGPKVVSEAVPEKSAKALEQEELVRRAFAGYGALESDFHKEKQALLEEDAPKPAPVLQGWGSWAGMGSEKVNTAIAAAEAKRAARKRSRGIAAIAPLAAAPKKPARKDAELATVIISEKRDKKFVKYQADKVPYPFTSREQYERSLRTPLGPEWNATTTFTTMNKPDVVTKAGVIIEPIKYKAQKKAGKKSK